MKILTALVLFALGTSADRDERHVINDPTPTTTPSPSPPGTADTTVSDVRYVGPGCGKPFPGPVQYVRKCTPLSYVIRQHRYWETIEDPWALGSSSLRHSVAGEWEFCRVCEKKVSLACGEKCTCGKWTEVKGRRKEVNPDPDGMFSLSVWPSWSSDLGFGKFNLGD